MQQDPIPAEEIVKYRTGVRDFKNYDNPSVSPERVGPNNFKAIRELAKRNKQLQENSQKQNPWGVSKSKFLEKGSGNHFETEKVPEVPKRPQTAVNKRNIENVSNFIVPRDGVNKHIMEVIQRSSVEAIPKYKGDMEIVKEMEPSRHKKNEYQSPVFKENSDSDVDFEDVPKSVFSNARQMKNQSDIVVLPQKPPQPKHQPDIVVPLKQQSDMSLFTENIKNTFLAMQKTMDRGFNAIEQRLYSLDQRMDEAYDRLEVVSEPKIESLADMRRSFVHPPLKNDVESQVKAKHPEKLNINSIETQTIPVLSPKETQTAALSKPPSSSRLEKPIIIKPNVEKSEEIDALSKIWIDVLHDLSIGKVEDAYIKVLNSGDDIYLLRLMHKTGTCLSKMSSGACKRILGRLGMILNSGFLEGIGVD